VPKAKKTVNSDKKEALGIPADKRVVLLQGAGINIHRGAEEAVQAMKFIKGAVLLIVGGGDVVENLKTDVRREGLDDRVVFVPRQTPDQLHLYTLIADVGLSLDKDTNLNYRFSLPNKLFDYVQAHVPVLASDLPEIGRIVRRYRVGELIENHAPEHIAEKLTSMLSGRYKSEHRGTLEQAASELVWENEAPVLEAVYRRFL
jgi:glycosyltransferase involved in cell wall biosynthesis